MSYFEAILMGLIQGATEFLPVSSSGHIALFTRITGVEPSLSFDLCLHLATLVAVVVVFRRELLSVLRKPLGKPARMLALATVVTALVVLPLRGAAEAALSGGCLAFTFMFTALALAASELVPRRRSRSIGALDAIVIGAAQGLAAFPGLSRSGLTTSAGRLLGVSDEENVPFCFMLSLPIILGSAAVNALESGGETLGLAPGPALVGCAAALVAGLLSLRFMKKALVRGGKGFAIYLSLLSVLLTLNDVWLHIF